MGTHPIFESDFDCLTERKYEQSCPRRPKTCRSSCRQTTLRLCCQPRYRYRRQIHWCRCWYRNSFRLPHHWLRQKPIPQGSTFLICHFGIRPLRSHGSFLLDGCFLDSLCSLNHPNQQQRPQLVQILFIVLGYVMNNCNATSNTPIK